MSLLKNSFLIKCKNTISLRNQKDYNLLLILNQQKKKKQATPITIFTSICEKLAPGAALLPKVRAGRVSFTPGKIKQSSAIFKSLQWILQEVNAPRKEKFPYRFSEELKHIMNNTGASLNHKKNYIKEIRLARLNFRRRHLWIKYLTRKNFRRRRKITQRKENNKLNKKTKTFKLSKIKRKLYRKKYMYVRNRVLKKRRKYRKFKILKWQNRKYRTSRKFSKKKNKMINTRALKKKKTEKYVPFINSNKPKPNTIIFQKKTWKRLSFYETL